MEQLRVVQRRQASRARHQQHSSDQRSRRMASYGDHGAGRVGLCAFAQGISAITEASLRAAGRLYLHRFLNRKRLSPAQEFHGNHLFEQPKKGSTMTTFQIATALNALAIIAALTTTSSQAQTAQTIQAALSKEAGTLSDKFTGMARVMAGKYVWKPAQGVHSVGEVFNLIVVENGILAGTLTGAKAG